jgi:signal transduction histidine kinase
MQMILRLTKHSVARYSLALVGTAAALLFAWPGLSQNLFSTGQDLGGFMPHSHCYLFVPALVRLHLASDLAIGVSYVAISLTLAYLIHRTRRDIPFHWVFLAFGLFIIACGMTHFMEVWTLDNPTYWLAGYVKLVTAAASVATALVLPPLIPRAVRTVSDAKAAELHRANLEKAHAELEELYRRVKETDELKTRFFANVSHELRTPLALILGPVEKLSAAPNLSAEQRRALEVVRTHAQSLLKQVNDLLDVSRLEAGKTGADYAEIDLTRLVRLTASHFESLAAERGMRFAVEAPDSPLRAEADPEKLERVLLNLLANAFKFTPGGGSVRCRLRTERDGTAAVIEVEDAGPGVSPEQRERIFERYGQGAEDTARRFGGTGLGLAIAREFVELHGGEIAVEDAPSGGALFRVRVPLRAPAGSDVRRHEQGQLSAATREAARLTIEEVRASTDSQRADEGNAVRRQGEGAGAGDAGIAEVAAEDAPLVLVVEDNAEMNRFISDALRGEYRVESAFDGRQGLEEAERLRPDLIVSDVMMPRLGGDALVREVRARRELDGVPVVMLTAKADDELRVRLLREGAQDYLMKPFSVEELRARVGQQVAVKRTRELLQRELESKSQDLAGLAGALAERRREAEEASRMKDEFLATVSHELRTPLTPILGWAQMLRSMNFDEDGRARALDTIERNARAQQHIVDDLLDVARSVTGKLRLKVRPVRLAPVVEAAAESARTAAEAKGVRLSLDLGGPDGAAVSGDPDRLQQIVWNLLSNAVKFTDEGGEVSVGLRARGGRAEIVVSDDGIGIRPELLDKIFERFVQADGSTTRQYGGLGLGLSIVRYLAELHGGSVRAESPGEGRGATFTVTLPLLKLRDADSAKLNDEGNADEHPASRHPPSEILSGVRVLVVDDEHDTREMVSVMLAQFGAEVLTAGSAAEAFDALAGSPPDVLVSDIEMPGEDGYALIRRVRSLPPDGGGTTPSVALTAHTRVEDRERALAEGFQFHVNKPVGQDELIQTVARLAGRRA